MISLLDVYHVLEATVPLYVAMILAYVSIRWWKLFTPDQCSGINKFVAKFSIPLLSFRVISTNNPYTMDLKLMLSDAVQKLLALLLFAVLSKVFSRGRSFDWIITGLSVSTLPNTLIVGIPLLKGLYGNEAATILAQIVVLQSLIWYTILLFLFEFRAARSRAVTTIENTGDIGYVLDIEGEAEASGVQYKPEDEEANGKSLRKYKCRLILLVVARKLAKNPNTYACLAGLIWALISFRWGFKLPIVVNNSISILADGGLGMAMFSLGLFMASQSSIIACGTRLLLVSMVLRFIVGPALMAIPSYSIGMRGIMLSVAITQAALPQGIVPFVFAKEYGLHPDILSTGIIIGMFLAIPIVLAYNFLLSIH